MGAVGAFRGLDDMAGDTVVVAAEIEVEGHSCMACVVAAV